MTELSGRRLVLQAAIHGLADNLRWRLPQPVVETANEAAPCIQQTAVLANAHTATLTPCLCCLQIDAAAAAAAAALSDKATALSAADTAAADAAAKAQQQQEKHWRETAESLAALQKKLQVRAV